MPWFGTDWSNGHVSSSSGLDRSRRLRCQLSGPSSCSDLVHPPLPGNDENRTWTENSSLSNFLSPNLVPITNPVD